MTRARDEIEQDLPFAVNGTLSDADLAAFTALMDKDEQLRAEFEAMSAIRARMQAEDARSPGEIGLARLLRDVGRDGAAQAAPNRTWIWQLAAAVAVAAFLGETLFLDGADDGGFQLAGVHHAETADLVVSFAPGATEDQIRTLLVGVNAEIVSGPSALGFYRLVVIDEGQAAIVTAADALMAAADVVESVQNAQN